MTELIQEYKNENIETSTINTPHSENIMTTLDNGTIVGDNN
jgi:hypothetical protein